LNSPETKQELLELVDDGMSKGVSKTALCEVFGVSIRTLQRWQSRGFVDGRKGAEKCVSRKLSEEERQQALDAACSKENAGKTPPQIVATLCDEGKYICSTRSMYRILKAANKLYHRRDSRKPRQGRKAEPLVATGPNQIWSWDITWLKSAVKGWFFFAYVVIDIWSRKIVGWEIHESESPELASGLFRRIERWYKMKGIRLRSDNGGPMKGSSLLSTLYDLGVMPSFSRPRVSNDNAFIESFFKTVKFKPGYPGRFGGLAEAREWMAAFVNWYNTEHQHSGIGYVTPEEHHSLASINIFAKRNEVMSVAREKHPERWVGKTMTWGAGQKVVLSAGKKKVA
jgi:transposase InsO family protein